MFSCTYVWYVMSCTHLSYSLLRRQLAVAQQPRDLEERRLLGELLDRIAAIAQDALVAVDERDRALARRRVHERGIVRHQPELFGRRLDLSKVHRARRRVAFDAALQDLNGVALVGARILDVERSRRPKLAGGVRAASAACFPCSRSPERSRRSTLGSVSRERKSKCLDRWRKRLMRRRHDCRRLRSVRRDRAALDSSTQRRCVPTLGQQSCAVNRCAFRDPLDLDRHRVDRPLSSCGQPVRRSRRSAPLERRATARAGFATPLERGDRRSR